MTATASASATAVQPGIAIRRAVEDLGRFETLWPGLASRLITRRLDGLKDYARILEKPDGDIKTVIDIHPSPYHPITLSPITFKSGE